ncbi:MAG: stage II sporulation protein M [Thermodesulfobacteriota bacterium]
MDILLIYANVWKLIDWALFLIAAGLFFLGVFFAPIVVKKEVGLLIRYPLWIWGLIKRHIDLGAPFFRLWALIFSLNSFSLFCNLVSGFSIILPPLFAFLLGIHIAIISLKEMGKLRLVFLILNPVSLLELPAAWMSLSLGMRFGRDLYLSKYTHVFYLFERNLMGYVFLVLPLLALAGFIEVSLIKVLGKATITDSGFDREKGEGQNGTSCDKL